MKEPDIIHVCTCYMHVKEALNAINMVEKKDKYMIQIQGALYKMEDMMYQYATDAEKRRA